MDRREAVLREAIATTCGDRDVQYDAPESNFQAIADIWTVILDRKKKLHAAQRITAHDVALCMVGVKLAREAYKHKADNCVDGAAYFGCADEVSNG